MNEIIGIVEARSTLPALIERLAADNAEPVLIGSHRRARVAPVPLGLVAHARTSRATLARAQAAADTILRLAAISNLRGVSVFGSVARGDDIDTSDVDLLVDTTPETSLIDLARFERDMEALFDRSVDVVTRASLDPERDAAILREAIAL